MNRDKITKFFSYVYTCDTRAGKKEYITFVVVGLVYLLAMLISGLIFTYWLGRIGAQYTYVDELMDIVLRPDILAFMAIWSLLFIIGGILMTVAQIFAAIRRLKDLNLSGWYCLALAIPVLNVFPVAFLCLLDSRDPTCVSDPEPVQEV